MGQFKSIKITFDFDDEYQVKLYNHIKQRSNGSSYVRTLIHQDMYNNKLDRLEQYKVVKEQDKVEHPLSQPIKINSYQNNSTDESEDNIFIDDFI